MILLIEDDAITRMALAESLRASGEQVLEAEDGEEALDFLRGQSVKLVVMDFALPGINGSKLMELIHYRYPNLPLILISGYLPQGAGEAVALMSNQAIKFFAKPVRPSALVRTVQELLSPAWLHSRPDQALRPRSR